MLIYQKIADQSAETISRLITVEAGTKTTPGRNLTKEEKEIYASAQEILGMVRDSLKEIGEKRSLTKEEEEFLKDVDWDITWSNMTMQQRSFYKYKTDLKSIEQTEAKGVCAAEKSKQEKDRIKMDALDLMARYAWHEAKKRLSHYPNTKCSFDEIYQAFAEIFFKKLPDYDPVRAAPTTYFLPYINEIISEYILFESHHLSIYDAKNIAKVKGAIGYYDSKGIRYDNEMLSKHTGLSQKVVKKTLEIASETQYANIDDQFDLQSQTRTPEQEYIQEETDNVLYNALKDVLTEQEYAIFLYKVNPDETKERSDQAVAEHFGMPRRDVKKIYEDSKAKLAQCEQLKEHRTHQKTLDTELTLQSEESGMDAFTLAFAE